MLFAGLCQITGCLSSSERAAAEKTGGNPRRGVEAIRRYGCAACHTIPGIKEAVGRTGPSLGGVAGRPRIADVLENSPENLVRWIENPRSVYRFSSMPTLNISESEARDIAAYLYTLK
jgi:cytochrome c2